MVFDRNTLVNYMQNDLGIDASDLDDSTPLFSSGIIDSFSLISLITFIEKQGNFRISPTDVNLDNMDSIERLMAYIQSQSDAAT